MLYNSLEIPQLPAPYDVPVVPIPEDGEECPYTGITYHTLRTLAIPCNANDYDPPVARYMITDREQERTVVYADYHDLQRYLNYLADKASLEMHEGILVTPQSSHPHNTNPIQ